MNLFAFCVPWDSYILEKWRCSYGTSWYTKPSLAAEATGPVQIVFKETADAHSGSI